MSEWILLQEGAFIYVLLFLLLVAGALGFPMPEDVPLVLGGVLAQMGKVKLGPVAVVCYTAIVLGDLIIYSIGRWLGPAIFQKEWFKERFSSSRIRRVKFRLEKRSLLMILLARHLFYIRTLTFLTCGAVRMNFYRFLIADACAALISMPIMLGLGYLAAEHLDLLFKYLATAKHWSLAIVIVAFGCYLYVRYRRLKRREGDESTAQ
ncbi:MAG: hypothetical protein DCC75_08565 [Proteobacteria bacterium]|nr:MAG: hypothetical protein DCC75_08565 [Pseudomonadota bacterium]